MWIITKFGFFSIVQKPGQAVNGTLTIRGRVESDLEALRTRYLPSMGPIEADGGTDYKYRAVAPASLVAAAMCAVVADTNYPNFKDAVAAEQGPRRAQLYHELWTTLLKLDEQDHREQVALEVDPVQGNSSTPDDETTDVRSGYGRFVDTEDDLACWGISPPKEADQPAEGDTLPMAFGGVVFDTAGRVLLRKPAGEFDGYVWTFPKGRPNPSETGEAAAIREVREETGVQAAIVAPIPGRFRGSTSITTYFRMTPVHDFGDFDRAETEQVIWAWPAEAQRLIGQSRNTVGMQRDIAVMIAATSAGPSAGRPSRKAALIRIAVDHSYGEWNGPVARSGSFVYVPIPEGTTTTFHPGQERTYREVLSPLAAFGKRLEPQHVRHTVLPLGLHDVAMHLDPDFENLTYGDDGSTRGKFVETMAADDLLVFYAGLRPAYESEHKLIYAIVGLFVVNEVVKAANVTADRFHENAHTRKTILGASDIVVRAKPGVSGRLERCLPIGEYRDGAYRVRKDVLEQWGGLTVNDGYIQRSAVPPRFSAPNRFYEWFKQQAPTLVRGNY